MNEQETSALDRFREMGLLRNLLQILAVVFIGILPFSEPSRILEGWQIFFGGIVPAMAPLIFVVMMFDVLMANVLKGDVEPDKAIVLRRVIRYNTILGAILLGLWLFSFSGVLIR